MTGARRGDLGKRIFYRVARALVLTPLKAIFWVRVRGREKIRCDFALLAAALNLARLAVLAVA